MQKPAKRLGRGLSSLISVPEPILDPPAGLSAVAGSSSPAQPGPASLPVGQIRPNRYQPRRDIPPEALQTLSESIRHAGIIQPVLVRQAGPQLYELIAGERRWRAAQMAGLLEVPAVIREASDAEMLEIALVENIFREDLNAIDRAQAYRRYCDEFGLSADEVATRLGEDRTTVTNYLRLLDLPSEVKDWVAAGRLSMGHARALLGLKLAADIIRLGQQVMNEELSVRALEKRIRERVEARAAAVKPPQDSPEAKRAQIRNLEQLFMQATGTKVEIHESRRKGKGKIIIHYYSLDDFDRITERFGISES